MSQMSFFLSQNELRCRTLYGKLLEWNPANCSAWCRFTELERSLQEDERARSIFELAISQPVLDMPELLWKAYIDFEIENGVFHFWVFRNFHDFRKSKSGKSFV